MTIEKTLIKELKNKTLLFEQKGKLEILDSEDFDADEVAENLLSVTQHVQPFVWPFLSSAFKGHEEEFYLLIIFVDDDILHLISQIVWVFQIQGSQNDLQIALRPESLTKRPF